MISEHNEIEAKLAADNVSVKDFQSFMEDTTRYDIVNRKAIESPDGYYEQGPNVVRQRGALGDDAHELTVKLRKSDGSTRDRLEIDLHFSEETGVSDVVAFLEATGFKKAFTLTKQAYIYWVQLTTKVRASFVIYDVWQTNEAGEKINCKRFIEVEAEKGSDVEVETAKRHVREQVKILQAHFNIGEPLNESLYEIYSGKRYQTV
jgi:adenylate cyclase class IV